MLNVDMGFRLTWEVLANEIKIKKVKKMKPYKKLIYTYTSTTLKIVVCVRGGCRNMCRKRMSVCLGSGGNNI